MRVSRISLLSSFLLLCVLNSCSHDHTAEEPFASTQQPLAHAWTSIAPMPVERGQFGSVLLGDGRILAIAGVNRNGFVNGADVLDPATGTWTSLGPNGVTGNITNAQLLSNGKVLVTSDRAAQVDVLEIATGTWTTAPMSSRRSFPSVTGLTDGRVLVAGGTGDGGVRLDTAEIYDPETNTFAATGSMQLGRNAHAAARLRDGRVLVASGFAGSGQVANAEIFDPVTGTWSVAAPPLVPRHYATATTLTDGRVLLVGGYTASGVTTHAELYDPVANTWTATGALTAPRNGHTATLLPSGLVVVTGGSNGQRVARASSQTYDPATGTWSAELPMQVGRENASAVLLPSGRVLVMGGFTSVQSTTFFASAELLEPAADAWQLFPAPTGVRNTALTALLPDGDILLVGGHAAGEPLASAQRWDAATNQWGPVEALDTSHVDGTLSSLASGDLLAVGGSEAGVSVARVDRYASATGAWSAAAPLPSPRRSHTSTVLADRRVFVVGGEDETGAPRATAHAYDASTDTWTALAAPAIARARHGAVALQSGRVLTVGGVGAGGGFLASAESYDPAAATWSPAGSMAAARTDATYILLGSGRVLATGGRNGSGALSSTEIYDPATNTWAAAAPMPSARFGGKGALLADGSVLVTGGASAPGVAASSAALFDPLTATWQLTATTSTRQGAMLVLPSGEAVLLGGSGGVTAERYARAATRRWLPSVTGPERVHAGCVAELRGTGLRGLSEGSGGAYASSPTDYPLLQLRSESRTWNPPSSSFSDTHARFMVPVDLPRGHYALSALVSGVPAGRMIEVLPNTPPMIADRSANVAPGSTVDVSLQATDPDLDQELTWEVVTAPLHGTLSGTLPEVTYTAEATYQGVDTFTVRATDSCGAISAEATVTVTVTDGPPRLQCPQPQSLEATSPEGATALWPDALSPDNTFVSYEPARGTTLPLGNTTVTARTESALGSEATCTFVVTVRDTTAPIITCPADLRVTATSASGARVEYDSARASDAVTPSPSVVGSPASGSFFALGSTTVTATATDDASNLARCTFVVTVDAAPRDLDPDLDLEPDLDPSDMGVGGGCACDTRSRGSSPTSTVWLGALAATVLRRLGRRQPRTRK